MFIFAISSSAVGRRTPFRKVTSRVSFSIPAARWSFGLGRRHRHASPIGIHGFPSHCRFHFARWSTLTWTKRWPRNRELLFPCNNHTRYIFFYAIIERLFDTLSIVKIVLKQTIFVELISEMLIIVTLKARANFLNEDTKIDTINEPFFLSATRRHVIIYPRSCSPFTMQRDFWPFIPADRRRM